MAKDESRKAAKGGVGERKAARRGAKLTPPPSIALPDRSSSFSQLLAGAMASPAALAATPVVGQTLVLTIAVDPSRFPMVATTPPAFIASPSFQVGRFGVIFWPNFYWLD
ncbi:hypothetical protein ACLOJK_002640 [Asimina triloba]